MALFLFIVFELTDTWNMEGWGRSLRAALTIAAEHYAELFITGDFPRRREIGLGRWAFRPCLPVHGVALDSATVVV